MNFLRIALGILLLTIFGVSLGACYVGPPIPRSYPSYGVYPGYGSTTYIPNYGYPTYPAYGSYGYGYSQPYVLAPPVMRAPIMGGWRGGYGGGWHGGGGYGRFRR